ncbi:hypothetical protein Ciccas_014294 [Cichlidogyrus casuarinus]|uniref:Uncharacterized protein n=1 Tax=Cichlidogyrus casuarinus TaxID=1844966 RepID=A0ABD2PIM4_9PLAT
MQESGDQDRLSHIHSLIDGNHVTALFITLLHRKFLTLTQIKTCFYQQSEVQSIAHQCLQDDYWGDHDLDHASSASSESLRLLLPLLSPPHEPCLSLSLDLGTFFLMRCLPDCPIWVSIATFLASQLESGHRFPFLVPKTQLPLSAENKIQTFEDCGDLDVLSGLGPRDLWTAFCALDFCQHFGCEDDPLPTDDFLLDQDQPQDADFTLVLRPLLTQLLSSECISECNLALACVALGAHGTQSYDTLSLRETMLLCMLSVENRCFLTCDAITDCLGQLQEEEQQGCQLVELAGEEIRASDVRVLQAVNFEDIVFSLDELTFLHALLTSVADVKACQLASNLQLSLTVTLLRKLGFIRFRLPYSQWSLVRAFLHEFSPAETVNLMHSLKCNLKLHLDTVDMPPLKVSPILAEVTLPAFTIISIDRHSQVHKCLGKKLEMSRF